MRAGDTPAPDAYQSKISKGLGGSSVSFFYYSFFLCFIGGTSFVPDTTQLVPDTTRLFFSPPV